MNKIKDQSNWIVRPTIDPEKMIYYFRPNGKLYWNEPEEISNGKEKPYTSKKFIPNAPFRAYFDFTYRCNLECRHCITSSSSKKDISQELSTNRILGIISELAQIGVMEIQTGGGEPFIHPHWEKIYQYVVDQGLNIIITTNGQLINSNIINKLKQINPIEVRVSFDGGSTMHDHIRGENSYLKALRGTKLLVESGLNITVRLTLCGDKDEEIPILFNDISKLGIDNVKIALIKSSGRAAEKSGQHLLRFQTKIQDVNWLTELGKSYNMNIQLSADDFPVTVEEANDPKLRYMKRCNCGAGFETAYISPYGELLGCVTIPSIKFGILKEKKFMDAWQSHISETYRNLAIKSNEWRICDACMECDKDSIAATNDI